MNTREWALLTFTILGQLAVGALLVLMVVRSYATAKAGLKEADRMTDGPLFIVVPIMGLALLASLLHLSNPGNVVRAVPNLGSSWLSREVVLSVAFVILAALYTLLQWRKIGTNGLRTVLGWIAAVIGVLQVYAMAMVYMIRTQPAWNTPATLITFFVASLLLGVLAVAVALLVNYNAIQKKDQQATEQQLDLLRGALQGIALTAIVLLGIEFLVLPVYIAYLATQGAAALESIKLLTGSYGITLTIRLLLVFIGAGVVAAYLFRNVSSVGKERFTSLLVYSAFVLVLAAEVMGRFLFYATHVGIGL
jgi:anaerobic dimethyl sulfoxide reductase subunit C (anchor subunit)